MIASHICNFCILSKQDRVEKPNMNETIWLHYMRVVIKCMRFGTKTIKEP